MKRHTFSMLVYYLVMTTYTGCDKQFAAARSDLTPANDNRSVVVGATCAALRRFVRRIAGCSTIWNEFLPKTNSERIRGSQANDTFHEELSQ